MDEHPWSKKLYRLLRERDEALLDIFAPIYAYVNLKKNELSQIEVKALEKAQDLSRSLNSHLITLLRDEITQLKEKIKECTNELEASKDRLLVLDSSNIEASKSIQILADENHALQLELHSRETELGILKKEHDRLINRWLEYKAKEVEKMNAEHEQQMPITIVGEKEQAVKTTLPESIGLSLRKLHTDQIRCISFSHCQSWVASGGVDCKAFLHFPFSDASKDPVEITSCSNSITSISCSKYGSQILLGLNDGGLQVANVDSKQNIKISAVLSGHIGTVSSAYFLPKSQKAVSSCYDRTIKIWDLNKSYCFSTISCSSSCTDICNLIGDNTTLVSGHFDSCIRVWHTGFDFALNSCQEIKVGNRAVITSVASGSKKPYVLTSSRDNKIRLYDFRNYKEICEFSAQDFRVGSNWSKACFSPNDDYIVSGSSDGYLYIWETYNKEKIQKIFVGECINALCWEQDLICGTTLGNIHIIK